ncbi:hypothetical protein Pint_07376 [Pistacia integerrima]|uniref:Uncharacterized protein n=1 Tax=Pistacia integerrima TaxID=434235 RepID=A0ACC0XYY5_9ROSI|nr:hypothetical protein Pint_07376 [Pistacia integerrima]
MAALYSSFLKLLLFLSVLPFISSLSTVSISETSNEPLICALVLSPNGNSSFLNCSSSGIGNSNVSFSGVVAGDGFVCGLRNFATSYSSAMNCWRFSSNGTVMEYKRIYQGPALHQLEAGNSHICGVVNDTNRLQCWQWPEFNSSLRFSSIAVGQDFVCGLSETGRISCNNGNNVTSTVIDQVPDGNYSVIDAGFSHACAISLDHSLRCWGDEVGETPRDMFNALALGENRSCALRSTNGTVVCWGQDNFTLPAALQETYFVSIEAKRRVFCGVEKSNFSLYCWGEGIDNFRMVFEKVLPGPCRRDCPYGILAGSGTLCGQMGSICEPLPPPPPQPQQPSSPPPTPPTPAPSPQSGDASSSGGGSGWSAKMVVLLVVGCVGSLSLLLVFLFFLYRQCKGRGCRVHDSGRLDEDGAPAEQGSGQRQNLPSQPVLEKRLSQLASMGNAGHLEEFSLQVLLEATDNFSANHKIGTGSFGSVYYGILDDGRQVAIKRAEVSNTSSRVGGTRLQEDKDHAFLNELESLSRLHHKNLDEIHRVLDRKVPPPTPYEIEAVAYVGYLAVDCVTQAGRDRPSMTEIVNSLDRALTACTVPPLLSRSSTNSST